MEGEEARENLAVQRLRERLQRYEVQILRPRFFEDPEMQRLALEIPVPDPEAQKRAQEILQEERNRQGGLEALAQEGSWT
ncbi:MAG: hypothetical protein VXZ72_02495 [Chlamydiota bacterium]|nr:hypothetical protein [Chlamydiota bacterium]